MYEALAQNTSTCAHSIMGDCCKDTAIGVLNNNNDFYVHTHIWLYVAWNIN